MIAVARKNGKVKVHTGHKFKVGHWLCDPGQLKPSPENATLYRERNENDADWSRFVESVAFAGEILQEILVSRDGFIISGHQRTRAATECRFDRVPIRVLNLYRSKHTPDEWLKLLRSHNTGREKSVVERIHERMVDVDPNDVHRRVIEDKLVRSRPKMEIIDLGNRTATIRAEISREKRPMADAIKSILQDLQDYLPVSVRKVHYKLLEAHVLRNASDPGSLYINNKACSADASNMLTRMRLSGEIPFEWIEDETRTETIWESWKNAAEFIAEQQPQILSGYGRDLMQSQCVHFEIVVEKLTIYNFLKPVAARYTIPVNVIRGNSSIPPRYKISQRYKQSGKQGMMLLCLGDCDPSGDNIVESTLLSLRDEFACEEIKGVRVGLTHEQAEELGLPASMDANARDPNYQRFSRKHNRTDTYEMDAVDPRTAQQWLDEAIRAVIDTQAYNAEVELQAAEVAEIEAKAAEFQRLLRGI